MIFEISLSYIGMITLRTSAEAICIPAPDSVHLLTLTPQKRNFIRRRQNPLEFKLQRRITFSRRQLLHQHQKMTSIGRTP